MNFFHYDLVQNGFQIIHKFPGLIFKILKDKEGNLITENHPYYELSKAIQDFLAGQKLVFTKEDLKEINLERFLEGKRKHFCAGYLSKRFSKIILACNKLDSFFDKIPYFYHRISEREQYKTALQVWEEFQNSELKNSRTSCKK